MALYDQHPVNVKYNTDVPLFVNPIDPRQYILLKLPVVEYWGSQMVSRLGTL